MRRSRPPNVYIHRPEGTYHFHEDGPDHGYEFVSLKRKDADQPTPFHLMSRDETTAGWVAFDEFMGSFKARYRR